MLILFRSGFQKNKGSSYSSRKQESKAVFGRHGTSVVDAREMVSGPCPVLSSQSIIWSSGGWIGFPISDGVFGWDRV